MLYCSRRKPNLSGSVSNIIGWFAITMDSAGPATQNWSKWRFRVEPNGKRFSWRNIPAYIGRTVASECQSQRMHIFPLCHKEHRYCILPGKGYYEGFLTFHLKTPNRVHIQIPIFKRTGWPIWPISKYFYALHASIWFHQGSITLSINWLCRLGEYFIWPLNSWINAFLI